MRVLQVNMCYSNASYLLINLSVLINVISLSLFSNRLIVLHTRSKILKILNFRHVSRIATLHTTTPTYCQVMDHKKEKHTYPSGSRSHIFMTIGG